MTFRKSKGSVWDDLIDDPVERESLRTRSALAIELTSYIDEHKLTNQSAADLMNVDNQKIEILRRGDIDKLDIETLTEMAKRVKLEGMRGIGWEGNLDEMRGCDEDTK